MLLGGLQQEYRSMYEDAIETAKKHLFFQPMNKDNLNILISGSIQVNKGRKDLDSQGQHLVCFAGGMMGIGAKIFDRDDLSVARKLVDGCIWAYASMPSGIMPETFHALPCDIDCQWDRGKWQQAVLDRDPNFMGAAADLTNGRRLPLGFTNIGDRRYILRYVWKDFTQSDYTKCNEDLKLSSQFLFYIGLLAIRRCKTKLGQYSRPLRNTHGQTLLMLRLTMSRFPLHQSRIAWKAFGLRKL